MKTSILFSCILLSMVCFNFRTGLESIKSPAQLSDTIRIRATDVNTSVLRSGTHQYLVYLKNGKDSSRINYQFWSREIQFVEYQGKKAVQIRHVWEDSKSVVHTVKSICDAKTFYPIYHENWWRGYGNYIFDFSNKTITINNKAITDSDTSRVVKNMYKAYQKALNEYILNWHLDLEVFPTLPYKNGRTFLINFYDPGFPEPAYQAYTVVGEGELTSHQQQKIKCWLLRHESKHGKEVFWISKKTKEVLKLEHEFEGKYRYKIKIGVLAP
jgi:hypothetical protein